MTLRFCLIGRGISGSPSPAMQNAAMRAAGVDGVYELQDVPAAELPGLMQRVRDGEFQGCNVTIPHKAAAAALCDTLGGDAAQLGVANTVVADGGRLRGLNTDAAGFALALQRAGLAPEPGATAVVLGAGGAAAAVALALVRLRVRGLTVVARSADAAAAMLERAAPAVASSVVAWDRNDAAVALATAGIVVNATPVGLVDLPLDVRTLQTSCTVADVRYRPRPVDLVTEAEESGRRATDGVEMLLCQGMLSFTRWTGLEPPWGAARAGLLEALAT